MKPRIGIFGLSGCWGEQIVILNCEDELLRLVGAADIVDFHGASSSNDREGALSVALVEGSVANAREEAALRRIRERAAILVACGTCACFGGVQSALNGEPGANLAEAAAAVYGLAAAGYEIRPHRPLAHFVKVDAQIPGCPIEKREFLEAVAALLNGDLPRVPATPVCAECKMQEQDCLLVSRSLACAGPVTAGGCGARCPGFSVPCIGCRGPVDEANFVSMKEILDKLGLREAEIRRKLRTFAAAAVRETRQ